MIGSVPFELASAYSLSVVPLFILMGALASRAGMSRELFDAANAIFSGLARRARPTPPSAPARRSAPSAARRSPPPRPSRKWRSRRCAATATTTASPPARCAAAGTLGILIPPSVILAIYSLIAEQSLPKLFAAALFPGLLLAALYIVVVVCDRAPASALDAEGARDAAERAPARRYGAVEARRCFSSWPWWASTSAGSRPPRLPRSPPLPPP